MNKKNLNIKRSFCKDIFTIPNMLSMTRIIVLPVILLLAYDVSTFRRNIGFFIYFLSSCTDFIDGYIARKFSLITTTGKLLDPLADKFSVLLPMILLLYLKEIPLLPVLLIFTRELYIVAVRDLAHKNNLVIGASFSGKLKTLLQMLGVGFYLSTPEFYHLFIKVIIDPNKIG